MGLIRVLDIAGGADTTQQGLQVWDALRSALVQADSVTVSFAGVTTATSSFVNVSFVRLLEVMSFEDVKRRVRIVEISRQAADMIKTRLQREAEALSHAA